MKLMATILSLVLVSSAVFASAGPAGDGVLNCTKEGNTKTVYIEAQDGSGNGEVKGVGSSLKIDGVSARALVARTADNKKLIATVFNGKELIQISATGFYTAYCSGCEDGQSLNYKTATVSKSQNGILTTQSGFACSLEVPGE